MSLTKVTYSMISGAPFNVFDYGAVADGVTDDLAAIQAAINAASAAGGGVVFLPEGTYATTDRIQPKTNVHLKGSGYSTRIICSNFQAILASRDDAPNNTTPHSNITLSDFYVESAWDGITPSHVYSCVELEFCNDCLIENIFVGKADDACIRVSGYRKGISSFTPSFTNPDFGFALRNTIQNCSVQEGYLGIELVGGAQCDILNNTILTSYFHGIRLAGGGWNSTVSSNRVMTCLHTAMYVEYTQNTTISNNPYLRSDRVVVPTGASFAVTRQVILDGNVFVGGVTDSILPGISENPIVCNNNITGNLDFREATNVKIFGNYISGEARVEGPATGDMYDNFVGSIVVDTNDMVQAGGAISYRNNLLISSKLPAAPTAQASILGTAATAPASGTFRVGDIVLNSAPASAGYIGWVCTVAGTPGTWAAFGTIA